MLKWKSCHLYICLDKEQRILCTKLPDITLSYCADTKAIFRINLKKHYVSAYKKQKMLTLLMGTYSFQILSDFHHWIKKPALNFKYIVKKLISHTNMWVIKHNWRRNYWNNRQTKENSSYGVFGEGGGYHLVLNAWTFCNQFYICGYKWLLNWLFQTIPSQRNTLFFFFYYKKRSDQIKDFLFAVFMLLPPSRKVGSSLRCLQLGLSHWRPHKSWFERVLTRKEETCQKRGLESWEGGNVAARLFKCYVWLSLPIRWQLNFNINMIILK